MSSKQLKSQESCLINPKLNEGSSLEQTRLPQRQWRNSWRYNLHHIVHLKGRYRTKDQPIVKAMLRRSYGKKILYATNVQEANAIVSRSRLVKFVEIEGYTVNENMKSKGNLVILANDLSILSKKQQNDDLKEDYRLLFKKILKHCQKAKVRIENEDHAKLSQALLSLKHLSIIIASFLELNVLGNIVRNLLNLETVRIYALKDWGERTIKKPKVRFFTSLQKLSRLKRMKLETDGRILGAELETDIEKFYSRPRNFCLSIKIDGKPKFGEEGSSFATILNAAEYLSISGESKYRVAKEEKKQLKSGMKNIVRILNSSEDFNLAEILSNCGSLKNLYIRHFYAFRNWKDNKSDNIKGFQLLKVAVLEFDDIYFWDFRNPISSPQFIFCSKIKENCSSLQHLSLYFSILLSEDTLSMSPSELSSFRENAKPYVQEISKCDKLKRLELITTPNGLYFFPLAEILSNKSIEFFELNFRDEEPKNPEWDSCFAIESAESEIKKLTITIPKDRKIPLCGIKFLNYIRKLDNLQVVELIDRNFGDVTFDFLYGLVTSLLDKNSIRKINILTKVTNNFLSKGFEMLLSNSLEIQLKNLFDGVVRDWKNRIHILKDLQLEEIFVGRLVGYSFDFVMYHKEMGITDKLVWTGREMYDLLDNKKEFRKNYPEFFNLYHTTQFSSDRSSKY